VIGNYFDDFLAEFGGYVSEQEIEKSFMKLI